jgi:hypothetical protein
MWVIFFVVPVLFIYCFLLPFSAFGFSYRHRHELDKKEINEIVGFLYQGLQNRKFYW